MNRLKTLLATGAVAVLLLTGAASVAAQDETDNTEICLVIDAQEAQFDAQVAAQRAQLAALDAAFGPEYDAAIKQYRDYITASVASFDAQVASARLMFDC